MKSKSLIAVLFCCALIVGKPAKAFWPVFDFTEIAPVYSQVSTTLESLKNLKGQLIELKDNLSALGNTINGLGAFAKDISTQITNAAETIKNAANDVAGTLGVDLKAGKGANDAAKNVEAGNSEMANVGVGSTESMTGVSDDKDDNKYKDISTEESIADGNIDSGNKELKPSTDILLPEPSLGNGSITPSTGSGNKELKPSTGILLPEPSLGNGSITPSTGSGNKELKPSTGILLPKTSLGSGSIAPANNEKNSGISLPNKNLSKGALKKTDGNLVPMFIEEEEEEEEVSEAEDQLRIDSIKENIALILSESASLSEQLNDLLDISLNTVHKNFEYNQEKLRQMEYVINKAQNIEEEDKKDLLQKISDIKQKQEETSKRLVGVIEAIKDNYNQEYNDKIVGGYKNYEKIAIAYVKGDATKKELKDAGVNLKKSIASIKVTPDNSVMQNIENSIKTMQKELTILSDNVKKAEDKVVSKV